MDQAQATPPEPTTPDFESLVHFYRLALSAEERREAALRKRLERTVWW